MSDKLTRRALVQRGIAAGAAVTGASILGCAANEKATSQSPETTGETGLLGNMAPYIGGAGDRPPEGLRRGGELANLGKNASQAVLRRVHLQVCGPTWAGLRADSAFLIVPRTPLKTRT